MIFILSVSVIERSIENIEILNGTYTSTITRFTPYCLGILIALIANQLKDQRYKFSKVRDVIITIKTAFVVPQSIRCTRTYEFKINISRFSKFMA